MLIPGRLVSITIAKNDPDKEAYLCYIPDRDLFCLMPRKHAIKEYKVGQRTFASIMRIEKGAKVYVSQQIPQFVKTIIKMDMGNFLAENGLILRRAVLRPQLGKGKVLVKCVDKSKKEEVLRYDFLNKKFIEYKKDRYKKEYSLIAEFFEDIKIYLIPQQETLAESIKMAFKPGPVDIIEEVTYTKKGPWSDWKRQVTIKLKDSSKMKLLLGKYLWNLVTVKKMFDIESVTFIKENGEINVI